jgi:hypothetical protein
MSEHISYWLTAAEPDRTHWSEVVRSLAKQFDAPLFEPHVTLYSAPLHTSDKPEEIIRAVAREFSEIVLPATGIGRTEQFTKTLFIEFATNEALAKLSGELKRRSSLPGDYELKPHLSLIYARLTPDVAQRLAKELPMPAHVRFDTVKAMVSGGLTRTRADVEAWRIVGSAKLESSHKW